MRILARSIGGPGGCLGSFDYLVGYFPAILSNTDCTVCASTLWLMSTFFSGDDPALLITAFRWI
jgi:hypothetical protein